MYLQSGQEVDVQLMVKKESTVGPFKKELKRFYLYIEIDQ